MANLRDKILNAQDIQEKEVPVPEWDVKVIVKGLTGAARNRVIQKGMDKQGNMDLNVMYPDLLIASTYDPESGDKIFNEKDRDALNAKSSAAIERIAQVALKMSGLDEEAQEAKAKN